jgi:hypothetical protein
LVKQLKIQFSGRLDQDQRQRLAEVDGQLAKELATREYNMAKHYDELEEFGAAKFYYAQVMKNHPATPLAEEARARLLAIGDEPERPSSSLEPVLNLLPESAERRAIAQVPMVSGSETRLASATEEEEAPKDGDAERAPTIRR